MRVKAIRDHFTDGHYRTAGQVFDHDGDPHEHIEPVDKADKEKWPKLLKDAKAKAKAKAKAAAAETSAEPVGDEGDAGAGEGEGAGTEAD